MREGRGTLSKRFTKTRLGEGLEKARTDWKRLDALTDPDIAGAIDEDPDSFEARPEWLENAVIVRPARKKRQTSIRFDEDMLEWFRAQGAGYQSQMNAVLRAYYEAQRQKKKTTKRHLGSA